MEGKKRYVAIVLFLLIGLTLFTFANPVEEQKGSKGNGSKDSEVTDKDTIDGTLGTDEQTQGQPQVQNQVADTSYADALAAVVKAEGSLAELDVDTARDLIDKVTNQNQKNELTERLDIVEEAIDAIELVETLEQMVEEATERDEIEDAIDYRTDKEIIQLVDALRNEEVQESLKDRLQILSRILDDNTAPEYEGVKDNEITNKDVSLTYSDTDEETGTENEVTVTVTLDGEEIDYADVFTKEGTYVVTLTDEAFNETKVTFTIDKTAPKFVDLQNGKHYETIKVEVDDDTATIVVKNVDKNESTEVANGTVLTEDATYYITATDEAGNETAIWVAIDTIAPTITGIDETKPTNKNEIVYVKDKFLTSVTIDGKEYTREDFEVGANNENFSFQKKVTSEGTHTVVAKDKYGNTTTKTFVIDKTAPARVYSTVRVNKTEYNENGTKYYYVKNGDSFVFAISFTEELAETPVVTISGRTVEMKLNEKVLANENKVLYEGTFAIDANEKELAQGTLEIKVSNVKDAAENEATDKTVTDQTPTSNGRKVIYDCKNPVVEGVNNNYYYNTPITIKEVNSSIHNVSPIATATIDGNAYELGTEYGVEGTHEFVAYDRAGNRLRVKFTIDYNAAKQNAVNANVSGYKNEVKQQYAKNGNKVVAYISINEELKHNPTFTFYTNGKEVKVVGKEDVVASKSTNANYPYVYTATLEINEELVAEDGVITFKVSDIYDKAGNQTPDLTKMSVGEKVLTLDRTAAKANYVAILSKGDNYNYAKNGDTIRFLVAFNEEIQIPSNYKNGSFVVEINGKEVHFMRSQGAGYEYIAEYKIPADEANLAEGELTFTIKGYTDLAGNVGENLTEATHGTYNKVIYDRTANMVTFTTLSTDNDYVDGNVYYVRNGNTITFRMGVREKFATAPVVTIGGLNLELEYVKYFSQPNHHEYRGTVTIPADAELTEGTLPIVISGITDLAGNKGFYYQTNGKKVVESVSKTATTNGKSVVYDNTKNFMVYTSFETSRNKVNNKVYYVKNGDTVTLSLGVREKFSKNPTVTVGGKSVELKYNKYFAQPNYHVYSATIIVDETIAVVDNKIQFTISDVTDLVGNEGFVYQYPKSSAVTSVTKTVTTNGKSVFVDNEAPVVTPSYTEKTIEEDSVEEFTDFPTFEVKDNSGLTVSQELVSGSVNPHAVGTYELVYRFTDELENSTELTVKVNVVDTTAPTLTGLVDGAYYNTHDTHAIPTATDKNGVALFVKTKLGDTELVSPWINEKEIVQVGTYQVYAVDKYGNKSEEITIHIDPYAPKVLVLDRFENVSGAYLPIKPVILEHNLDTISVTLDGAPIEFKLGDELTADGKYVMTVTDKANNKATVEFTMDSVAPLMTVSPLTLGVVDQLDLNDVSKIENIIGGIYASEDVEFQLLKATKNVTVLDKNIPIYEYVELPEDGIVDEEGQYILIAYDKAYNLTAAKFTVDRTAPVVTGVENGKYYNTDVTINIEEPNLNEVMILGTTLYKNNIPVSFSNGDTITEDGNYKLVAKDTAGNEAEPVTFVIDKTKPVITAPVGQEVLQGTNTVSVVADVTDNNVDNKKLTPYVTKIVDGVETELGYQETIDVTANGVAYKLYYTVTDKAGNKTELTVETVVTNITYTLSFNKNYSGTYNGSVQTVNPTLADVVLTMTKDSNPEVTITDETILNAISFEVVKELKNAGTYEDAIKASVTINGTIYEAFADYEMSKATINIEFPAGPLTKGTTLAQIVEGVTVTGVDKSVLEFKLYSIYEFKEVPSVDKAGYINDRLQFLGTYKYGLVVTLKDEYSDNYVLIDLPIIEGLGFNGQLYSSTK